MMYLLILEDGEIFKTDKVSDEDKLCVDAGILDVICVSGDHPRLYHEGGFHDIRDISELGG